MKKTLLLPLILIVTPLFGNVPEKHIVVVIASYNNEKYYEGNLSSVFNQQYENFDIIYINDASTDKTAELVQTHIAKTGKRDQIQFINNRARVGALENFYNAILSCEDNDIIVMLDGDDCFAHNDVLATINSVYANPLIWLTYGQYQEYPNKNKGCCENFPKNIIDNNQFRNYKWIASHPRTFYAKLFKKIQRGDLLYEGKFFPMAWDLAIMFPMLEMAHDHIQFIPEILYFWNVETPLSDNKVSVTLQSKLARLIRGKTKYLKLEALF